MRKKLSGDFFDQSICLILSFLLILSNLAFVFAQNGTQDGKGVGMRQKDGAKQKRVALVIGNSNYDNDIGRLKNPANDAVDIASALDGLGFQLIGSKAQLDLNLRQMDDVVREFGRQIKAGGVGVFYYSGHGVQVNRVNYLIPLGARIEKQEDVRFEALSVDRVLGEMESAENNLNILILDACRNNPLTRSFRSAEKGLAQPERIPTGTYIAFAARDGQTASDNQQGRNGLYTQELLKNIKQPNLRLEDVFINTRREVRKLSNNAQTPEEYGSVDDVFYFNNKAAGITAGNQTNTGNNNTEPIITEKDAATRERDAWDLVKNSGDAEDFRFYLKEFPQGANAVKAKIRLEETVWESVKSTNNKSKLQGYLNEFPNGANASSARILIRQLEARETANTPNTTLNTSNANKAGAIRKNSIGMELVYIPAGKFIMGSPETEKDRDKDEGPQHRVTIREGFYMGRYEVTQSQYEVVMGVNPSNFKNCDTCPVESVSWNDAMEFIRKLNVKNDGFEYRLPTESEWEYACRAETTTAFSFGDSLSSSQANFDGNYPYGGASKGVYKAKTTPVGSYQPNGFGLYDMHGNVYEWVEDIYADSYSNLPTDGSANVSVGDLSKRVLRGGSWSFNSWNLRSANRGRYSADDRSYSIGFRVVASLRTQ